ncbi:hemerythrin domain-containing protein [Massilia sp. GCM10020059]|uniref:Hemerythrin domain-containing protein n=1 Tax=Massilia agrisoli TaxID=2892444 RepID=A0ABS8IYJ7_9BURK|nr:hemerythrin domain-containing protein [Massilia agrisoli]MCC6073253.1 hemerythrin domain-containing protein [Massilia agrisoli]
MNIDKFKHQHVDILASVGALRALVKDGIAENADRICKQIISMSALIKLHLAVENSVLYPALQSTNNAAVAHMGKQFQNEMESISAAYLNFARRWNSAASLSRDPETFRSDANTVLKVLHARMQQENTVFYPAIEAL